MSRHASPVVWAAPILLAVVASIQIGLASAWGLSPWLGGGFGMFATVDSRSERHLVILLETAGLLYERPVPAALQDAAERVRAFPTRSRLESLARRVAEFERERLSTRVRVRIQLWQRRFSAGSLAPAEALVREVAVESDV